MPRVEIREGRVWVGDRPVPMVGGEMHYWRVPPRYWRACLDALRSLTTKVLSTYVPWEFHELSPGEFDFTGRTDPLRDLRGFLDLAADMAWDVFIRPGPFIYAEWNNAGVPERVARMHRVSKAYRAEARVWMEAVTEFLLPYLATRGGPAFLWQADNEMDVFMHWFEDELGLGDAPGLFQEWVAGRYESVEDLNEAWETRYAALPDARAWAAWPNQKPRAHRMRQHDYRRFQHDMVREALAWHVDLYRALGVDVPICGNYYPGGDVQNWREVAKVVDTQGIDWYPPVGFRGDAEEHRLFLDSCRVQRTYSPTPFVAELEAGVWHGYHDYVGIPNAAHYRLMGCSAMAAGITGWNWYMAVARDNWYFCPISERGEVRPEIASAVADLNRVAVELDLPSLDLVAPCSVVYRAEQIGTDDILRHNKVLSALYEADLDAVFWDPTMDAAPKGVLFDGSADWLPRTDQESIRAWIEAGGTWVTFRREGLLDEQLRPCDVLPVVSPDLVRSILGKKVEVELGASRAVCEGEVACWTSPQGDPIYCTQIAGRQQAVENADVWMRRYIGQRWCCGYVAPFGSGRMVVLGVPPNPELLRSVCAWAGMPLGSQASLSGVRTSLFAGRLGHVLYALNLRNADRVCPVVLEAPTLPSEGVALDAFTGEETRFRDGRVNVRVLAGSAGVWRIG